MTIKKYSIVSHQMANMGAQASRVFGELETKAAFEKKAKTLEGKHVLEGIGGLSMLFMRFDKGAERTRDYSSLSMQAITDQLMLVAAEANNLINKARIRKMSESEMMDETKKSLESWVQLSLEILERSGDYVILKDAFHELVTSITEAKVEPSENVPPQNMNEYVEFVRNCITRIRKMSKSEMMDEIKKSLESWVQLSLEILERSGDYVIIKDFFHELVTLITEAEVEPSENVPPQNMNEYVEFVRKCIRFDGNDYLYSMMSAEAGEVYEATLAFLEDEKIGIDYLVSEIGDCYWAWAGFMLKTRVTVFSSRFFEGEYPNDWTPFSPLDASRRLLHYAGDMCALKFAENIKSSEKKKRKKEILDKWISTIREMVYILNLDEKEIIHQNYEKLMKRGMKRDD